MSKTSTSEPIENDSHQEENIKKTSLDLQLNGFFEYERDYVFLMTSPQNMLDDRPQNC